MSSVDNRIVEMQFNNRRFEENARTTMSTLDKLKEKLNFRSSTKELQDFQNAADSFNLSRIANAVDEIGDKFSLMGQMGYQAMQRIASAALNAGTALVKSISIDQISAGMQKYEQETNVIQTLYGALKPKGTKLDEIYSVMETLTAYSDETSYSYTQMADAVSKFVNAGVDLHKAETVIEGISNAAALAGIGIHDTEIIYRNFADAIGKGGFRSQDWKSIKIAHMDTEWLKEAFINEAIAQGKLDKSGRVLTKAEKRNKKGEITRAAEYKNVREDFEGTLIKGWLDNDVINGVMLKYATRDLEGFGKEAFAAAQNAKTFTDVLDAVKDAASTGWSRSFRIIFGNLEEAIAFFTPMANAVIEVVNKVDEARNTMLQSWKDLGGRTHAIETLTTVWKTFQDVMGSFEGSILDAFWPEYDKYVKLTEDESTFKTFWERQGMWMNIWTLGLKQSAEAFRNWLNGQNEFDGTKRIDMFRRFFSAITSTVKSVTDTLSILWNSFKMLILPQLKPIFDAIMAVIGPIFDDILGFNKKFQRSPFLIEFMLKLSAAIEPITNRLPKLILKVRDFYNNVKKFLRENPRIVKFRKSIEKVFWAILDFAPKAIESLISFGKGILDTIKNSDEWKWLEDNFNKYIAPLARDISTVATKFNESLVNFFNMDTSDETTLWGKLKKRFSAFENLGPWFETLWEKAKKRMPWLQDVEDWWNEDPTINAIKDWVSKIGEAIDAFLSEDTSGETSIVGKIKARFEAMWDVLGPWLTEKWTALKTDYPILQTIEDVLTSVFGGGDETKKAAEKADEAGEESVGFLQKLWEKIEGFVSNLNVGNVATFVAAIWGLVKLYQLIKGVADWVSLGQTIKEAIEGIATGIEDAHKTANAKNMLTKAETLAAVAGSVWLFADAIRKVSELSWEQIGKGIASMVVMMGAELGFMKLLQMINGDTSTSFGKAIGEIAQGASNLTALIGLAANMFTFGIYLNMVVGIDADKINTGMEAWARCLLSEAAFIAILKWLEGEGKVGDVMAGLTGAISNTALLVTLSINMLSFAGYLNAVAGLNADQIDQGMQVWSRCLVAEGGFLAILKLLTGTGSFSSVMSSLASGISNSTLLITMSINMLSLAGYLKAIAGLNAEQISNGLEAWASCLLYEAGFMAIMTAIQNGGSIGTLLAGGIANSVTLLSLSKNLKSFGDYLVKVAGIPWADIEKGLQAMVGLFTGEGVLAGFLSLLGGGLDVGIFTAALGSIIDATARLAKELPALGQMNLDEILNALLGLGGVAAVLGLFIYGINQIPITKGLTQMLGIAVIGWAIAKMAEALVPLCEFNMDQIITGLTGMLGIAAVLGLFLLAMQNIQAMSLGKMATVIVSAIVMAGLMVAFAFAMSMIKDVDPWAIAAFGLAMALVGNAMSGFSTAIVKLSAVPLGASLKAELALGSAIVIVGLAVALCAAIAGQTIEGLGANIAMVGSYLGLYSDAIAGIDYDMVKQSIQMLKDMADAFVYIGAKDYGNLEVFRTNLTRIGGSAKLFALNTAEFDTEKTTAITGALKQMATDLSGFPEVADVGTSIGNIAGAIKLYSESLNGVNLDEAPDSTAIKTVFDTLKGAIPNDENLAEVASFASEGKGNDMTNFAIGLENIATAVSSFSTTAKDLDFTNMESAIDALDNIAKLNGHFGATTLEVVGGFGAFGLKVTQEKGNLSTFAEDIVSLGSSLEAFGTNISKVKVEDIQGGADVLEKIAGINEKLPKEGGISQWLTGSVSLTRFAAQLKLLGEGAKSFNDSIMGGDHQFDPDKVKNAGDALIKIAEINAKLPKTGGISSWFTGDESLSNFSIGLGELGKGVAAFSEGFGESKITDEMVRAVTQLGRIANIQAKLGSAESWYSMNQLARELEEASGYLVSFNTNMTGVTWASTDKFEALLTFAVDQQTRLGNTNYSKNLKDLGTDLKGFFDEVSKFAAVFLGEDFTKFDKISGAVSTIFGEINKAFENSNSEDMANFTESGHAILDALMDGVTDQNSLVKVENAVTTIANKIVEKVKTYTGTNQAFYNVGTWIPAGLASGIRSNQSAVVNAIIDVCNAGVRAGEEMLEINSPSRVFARLGMYSDMGLAQGFRDSIGLVDTAAGEVSQSALDTVLSELKAIQDLPLDQLEINPTIRPVLDTSDISRRAGMIDGMLGGSRAISFNTRQLEAQAQLLGDATGSDFGALNQRMLEINTKLDELTSVVGNLKVVMNNGALVGAIAPDIDKALGARARQGERGM